MKRTMTTDQAVKLVQDAIEAPTSGVLAESTRLIVLRELLVGQVESVSGLLYRLGVKVPGWATTRHALMEALLTWVRQQRRKRHADEAA